MTLAKIRSFPPVATSEARVLILGSMPGIASLTAGQYYAHPRNAFWRIMGELIGAGPDKTYDERLRVLNIRGVALWDVLDSCVRPGSLDTNISNETPNDFANFFASHTSITHVGLNGGKAATLFKKHAAPACPASTIVKGLPSTSPAYAAMSFESKSAEWRSFLPG
jgi:TDG/mug DNA glycosylase family protein